MKLSEIRGERSMEVIADLIAPCASIAADAELRGMLKEALAANGGDGQRALPDVAAKVLPRALRTHRDDVYAILAAVNGATAGEYAAGATVAGVLRDAVELLSDEEFAAFLS